MFPLSETARRQLLDTVREFQVLHGDELPKCDDAYQRLYPEQITLYTFREAWQLVQRELTIEAIQAATRDALRAEIEAQVRAELADAAGDEAQLADATDQPTDAAEAVETADAA